MRGRTSLFLLIILLLLSFITGCAQPDGLSNGNNQMEVGTSIKQIANNFELSYYRMSDGSVWVCGYDGNLNVGKYSVACKVMDNVSHIDIGSHHAVFLKDDGTVYTYGTNSYGQLGDGSKKSTGVAVQVLQESSTGETSALMEVSDVAVGMYHTLFLKVDGSVWGCGNNKQGQLGINPTNGTFSTLGIEIVQSGVKAIAAGTAHSLFLANDGTVYSCGDNTYGQLGYITSTTFSYNLKKIEITSPVVSIVAGANYSLFLTETGDLYGCGFNTNGELGLNNTTNQPVPMYIMGGVSSMSAGVMHTLILSIEKKVYSCGNNMFGQLGLTDVSSENVFVPTQIVGLNQEVASVSAGGFVSLFLMEDGSAWASGQNNVGQLGDGSTSSSRVPVASTAINSLF